MAKPQPNALITNGIVVPDFPQTPYEAIHRLVLKRGEHPLYEHFAGAWSALAYRMKAVHEHGDLFLDSLAKYGSSPQPDERHLQEKALYDFFSSTFSAFEAAFYGLYALGAWISPKEFSLASAKDQQRVNPKYVRDAYASAFAGDALILVLDSVLNDPAFVSLREIRNILTHRSAPGRVHFVGVGMEETTPTMWKLNNRPLDDMVVEDSKKSISRLLQELLDAFEVFSNVHL